MQGADNLCCGAGRDYNAEKEEWGWARPPPVSQKTGGDASSSPKKARRKVNAPQTPAQPFPAGAQALRVCALAALM